MSLLDELRTVEGGYNGVNSYSVEEDDRFDDVELISDEYIDSGRWVEYHEAVFKRGDEYVALRYEVPATEMQEGGDFDHEFYSVEPYEVTVTKYRKVEA